MGAILAGQRLDARMRELLDVTDDRPKPGPALGSKRRPREERIAELLAWMRQRHQRDIERRLARTVPEWRKARNA